MIKKNVSSRLFAVMLAICLVLQAFPAVFAESKNDNLNAFAKQTLPTKNISAFEDDYRGYETQLETFDGHEVRYIGRTGSDDTSINFCMYRWGMFADGNGDYVPLHTAKYIVMDYYYESPDASPALEGARMRWVQGRIVPEENLSQIIEFGWGNHAFSENTITANKWSKLIIPLAANPSIEALIRNKYSDGLYYLHQMKFYPLERNMGKNDALYLGEISIQSWHPDDDSVFGERTAYFFENETHAGSIEKAIATIKCTDLESFILPGFNGTLPVGAEFSHWICTFDGEKYNAGDSFEMLAGEDIFFVPGFNFKFNFSAFSDSYISGYPNGTFLPQENVTRAEAAKIIASILGADIPEANVTRFSDISSDAWYLKYVALLDSLGALAIFDENFEPDKKITRAELTEIIYALSDRSYDSVRIPVIPDVEYSDRWYDAVVYAASNGIIEGYMDGTFRPMENITRAETVTVINRILKRIPQDSLHGAKFSDIDAHWASGQIVAAASSSAENAWSTDTAAKEYVLTGNCAQEYITSLHEAGKNLTGDAIRRGIDAISEKMKDDILNTPNTYEIYEPRKNTYYVSEKNGNDDNDGKSPEKALKTIEGLKAKMRFPGANTAVLFERGGIYRGQINVVSGMLYGSYGTGDKPVISGSRKNFADPALWELTDAPNVYKLKENIVNVGIIVFDHASDAHGNYDGLYGKNRIYGANIADYKGLTKDLQFYSSPNTLYLCSTQGNPGERFSSIEIGDSGDVFDGGGNDITIDNVHVKHTGTHGIGLGGVKNLNVTNCEFSWLGGSLLGNHGETTTQFGNAVEVYGNLEGYYVKNNWMYQIYDTAVTHQGNDLRMNGIEYSGNLMEYVHWGIECWIKPTGDNKTTSLKNYLSQYNVLRMGGYGWGSIVTNRQSHARLYSFSTVDAENENMLCRFTIIDRCAGYLLDVDKRSCELFDSNIYVQDEGKTLGGLKGVSTAASGKAPVQIRDQLKDSNGIFVLIPEK